MLASGAAAVNRLQPLDCRWSEKTLGENTIASTGPVCYIDGECSERNMKV